MKEIIATGKNIEKAIANGLEQLNAKFEDVDVEVISEGGFFSKAKVKITLSQSIDFKEDEIASNKEKETKNEDETDGLTLSLKKQNKNDNDKEKTTQIVNNSVKSENINLLKQDNKIDDETGEQVISQEAKDIKTVKKTRVSTGTKTSVEFVKELLTLAQIDAQVDKTEDENYINLSITGENLSQVIGNKGECLSAIQYLSSLVKSEEEKGKKILIDAGNYKKNREEKVKELANRLIAKVKETGRWEKLRPMSAYERRIIHEVVNQTEGVRSESRGEEPNRYLTIYPDNK